MKAAKKGVTPHGGSSKDMEKYAEKKKSTKKVKEVATAAPSIDKDWQARGDLDTLTRAEEIKRDPARAAAAKSEAAKQKTNLARVLGESVKS